MTDAEVRKVVDEWWNDYVTEGTGDAPEAMHVSVCVLLAGVRLHALEEAVEIVSHLSDEWPKIARAIRKLKEVR